MTMDIARTEMIILTEDIEKMKDFYAGKLGLEVTRSRVEGTFSPCQ